MGKGRGPVEPARVPLPIEPDLESWLADYPYTVDGRSCRMEVSDDGLCVLRYADGAVEEYQLQDGRALWRLASPPRRGRPRAGTSRWAEIDIAELPHILTEGAHNVATTR